MINNMSKEVINKRSMKTTISLREQSTDAGKL